MNGALQVWSGDVRPVACSGDGAHAGLPCVQGGGKHNAD